MTLNIKGEWKVPRGGCKQLKTKDITVRWYENGSVLLDGPMKDEYSDILQRIATISPNNISNLGVDDFADVSPTHMPSLSNINNFMVNTSASKCKGTAILASTHFIKFLRDGQSLSSLRPQKHSRQDFQRTQ